MKRILSLLLVLCLLMGLCACGQSPEAVPEAEPSPVESETLPEDVAEPEASVSSEIAPVDENEEENAEKEAKPETTVDVAPADYVPDPAVAFIATDRHDNTEILPQLLSLVCADGYFPGLVAHGGDAVGSGPNFESNTNYAPVVDTSVIRSEVDLALSPEAQLVVLMASHDANMTDSVGSLYGECEGIECGDYYVYTLPEEYMDTEEAALEGSAHFTQWVQSEEVDPAKPIIVLSHKPIHHRRNDNLGAAVWHEAINQAATAGGEEPVRNIIFSHGHNHTADSTEYYYAPGSSIAIEGFGEDGESEDVINYAYITAGYLNQNNSCTVLKLEDGIIRVLKFNLEGVTELGTLERLG